MVKVLIVDDEQNIVDSLRLILEHEGYSTDSCNDGYSAIEKITDNDYELVLLDIKMPGLDGLETLEKVKQIKPDVVVIMISGHGTIETAVESTKKGAYNFLQKPFPDLPELKIIFKNAIDFKKSRDEIKRLKSGLSEGIELIGTSKEILEVKELIDKYVKVDSNIFISGESGTGKDIIARQLHYKSARAENAFVKINCANISNDKIDVELFGLFESGKLVMKGKIEEANGGTIYFDEVSNLSLDAQSKLLKVIEENKMTRSGYNKEVSLDLRYIFSTNKDMQQEIADGRFREDLFHRMNVLRINIPSLRERQEDIQILAEYFIDLISKANDVPAKKFSPQALSTLKSFRWPGNVRELKNFIERLIFSLDKTEIEVDDIEYPGTKHNKIISDLVNKNMSLNDFQNETEKIFISKMLNDYKYNVSKTAEALSIQRSHLYKLMSKYNIPLPSKMKDN
ncbi:sigma-54-dependent Fis family transcriptional regulator [Ignavibacteria bacterium CHB1]|jgi:Response regulator containing CheY-like receiver, AAA-type ATPase, and DNA-binding domains|nr:MAG: sigma-54-dependent Fis family transcriptional regulator [Chlorobiota bacterium]KXK01628.1 MAG: NtrC family response regulator [Chlorobi bacterium OLB4]MBV6398651.1 Regulatory protein AtoC [Ignavibacteria bacterium]MCC6885181.1 sigma-54-dependent Fis family transcriptional regulator [Ignavibacteriales bacterium]MCE7952029.1 sigma-54-dependent Fis family transcriptional regulator [Chlorobi bacterium CHB7]MDL1886413.1 sigma-54-dependent Fis family transcriptional regulator [Ignavibacteria